MTCRGTRSPYRRFRRIVVGFTLLLLLIGTVRPADAQGPEPTSLELIERAAKSGQLDFSTAMLYKAYTVLAPERLPSTFRSKVPGKSGTLVLREITLAWWRLSPAVRQEIIALGYDPFRESSEVQSRPSLQEERTLGTPHFLIHYTLTDPNAVPSTDISPYNGVPDYVEWVAAVAEEVWDAELNTLGWLQPPADNGEGGDKRYDIYLKDMGTTVTRLPEAGTWEITPIHWGSRSAGPPTATS